jgi:putative colanic acid biosynthesis UDP-glucose lipid carrier transferase
MLLAGYWVPAQHMMVVAVALVAFFAVAGINGTYRNWRGVAAENEFFCTVATWGGAVIVLVLLGFVTNLTAVFPRRLLLIWFCTAPLLIVLFRAVVRIGQKQLRARGLNSRGFAIVGINDLGLRLARDVEASPELGLKMVGFYDDRPPSRTPELPDSLGSRVGNLGELVEDARQGRVAMIFITFPMRAEVRIRGVLEQLADTTASVYLVPDFFVFELLHARWTNIGGLPVVSVFENPLYGVDGMAKRFVDLLLAGLLLLILALPLTVAAVLIRLTSRGPALFRQRRYGLDGRQILVWKLRTMYVCEDGDRAVQARRDDQRVTPIGRFLRRASLDELPQLLNVLTGSMSLVGPRPHPNALNEQFRPLIQGYMLRHKVKPGITGLAQVSGWRGPTDSLEKMAKRIEFDHQYIREWSIWLDMKILFKTALIVWRQDAF